jgi:hypothetical protein
LTKFIFYFILIFYDFCFSRNIFSGVHFKKTKLTGHVACMGYRRGTYRLLVGRREGKTPLGGPRRIIIHLEEVGWEDMDWVDLALVWDGWWALVNAVMNLGVPQNAGNLLTS